MSIIKRILTTRPDTGRGFESNRNTLKQIAGCFLIDKSTVIPAASIEDFDYWFNTLFASGAIIPIHGVKNFTIADEDIITVLSPMDRTIEIGKGKYRNSMAFHFDLAFHQIVEGLSGTDYSIIYYDENRNIILMQGYKGLRTSNIALKKFEFPAAGKAAMSVLNIELKDPSDLNLLGVVKQLPFNPSDIDRLYATLEIFVSSSQIIVAVKYKGTPINGLASSDFTITDDTGVITASVFNYGGGVYTFSNLSSTPSTGRVTLLTTLYLGCNTYNIQASAVYDNYETFESGLYETFESGNYELFNL